VRCGALKISALARDVLAEHHQTTITHQYCYALLDDTVSWCAGFVLACVRCSSTEHNKLSHSQRVESPQRALQLQFLHGCISHQMCPDEGLLVFDKNCFFF